MNQITRIASVFGFLGVSLGAFGAHALKNRLLANSFLEAWHTATLYLLLHAIALLALGLYLDTRPRPHPKALLLTAYSWALGCLLFSGSLYTMSLCGIKALGIITPFGGISFLIGWACLCFTKASKPS
jgi:uncharacterized membrane protein YgdD (TMEM256/DUF423 family)